MRTMPLLLALLLGCVQDSAPTGAPPSELEEDPPPLPASEVVWTARSPVDLAIDTEHVYWLSTWSEPSPTGTVSRGSVERWNKRTGEHDVLAMTADGAVPADLAIAGEHVYWTELHGWRDNGRDLGRDRLLRVVKAGAAVAQVVAIDQWFDSSTPRPNVVAAGEHVYWASRGGFTEPTGAVARVRDADPLAIVEPIGTRLDEPTALATDGAHVCFRTGHPNQVSTIWCAPVAGGPLLAVAHSRFPYSMLFIGEHLYWSHHGGTSAIERARPTPDTVVERVQAAQRPILLTAHAGAIYWSESSDVHGHHVYVLGDEPRALVESQHGTRAMAADAEHLYYIEHLRHDVRRVPPSP